jgi:hypothetical protein
MSDFDEKDLLTRELRDRSLDVGGHPVGFDAVRQSARRIRRRRQVVTGAVAAAVVATVVPAGLVLGGTSTDVSPPVAQGTASVTPTPHGSASASAPPKASSTPSPSASTPPESPDHATGISLEVLGTGPAPTLGWLEGRTFHHDGTTTQLPGAYTDVSPYKGGWLAIAHTDQGARALSIDGTGTITNDEPGGDRIAVSGDGTRIAWFSNGALHMAVSSGMSQAEGEQKIPDGVFADAVGWARNQVVYTTSGGDNAGVFRTDMAGTNRVVPGLVTSRGSSDAAGLIGGMVSYDNKTGTSCWAVVRTTGESVWRTCDWALEDFSTDGSLVLGIPSDSDGLGSAEAALLDSRTGAVRAVFDLPRGAFMTGFAWEDEGHVLASLYENGQWGVVRLAADGSARRVLPTVAGTDTDPPYHLVGR